MNAKLQKSSSLPQNNEAEPTKLTKDYLLGGRVMIQQPETGYRVAIDPVFLAAAVNPQPNDTILDVGSGVGAASLCLAVRRPDVKVLGVELQREYVRLAFDNVRANQLQQRIEILNGDLLKPPPRLAAGTFSHVMTNPPFFNNVTKRQSPNPAKASANNESGASLDQWINFCLLMVKPKGVVTFIYTAERLDELLMKLYGKLGGTTVYPLWPNSKKESKRVIVSGIKGSSSPLHLMPGMPLHEAGGKYTAKSEGILRHAESLDIYTP